jgi:hypothetical protein
VLGGNQDFVKPLVGGSGYIPIRFPRHAYLGVNFEAGYVAPFAGGEIPIFERFQLGGETSLRGFRTGSVLPLKKNDQVFTDEAGRILGGDKYFVLNLEYVFASIGPAKLLAFSDVGNVYHESQSVDLGRLRTAVGAELRIFLPIFQAPLVSSTPSTSIRRLPGPVRIPDHEAEGTPVRIRFLHRKDVLAAVLASGTAPTSTGPGNAPLRRAVVLTRKLLLFAVFRGRSLRMKRLVYLVLAASLAAAAASAQSPGAAAPIRIA